jgi:hypothetical protein
MNIKWKKLFVLIFLFFLWFLAADAYWKSKERDVQRCRLSNAVELVKHSIPDRYFESITDGNILFNGRSMVHEHCSWEIGGGWDWDSMLGLSYWEIILTAPIIYRYRFE